MRIEREWRRRVRDRSSGWKRYDNYTGNGDKNDPRATPERRNETGAAGELAVAKYLDAEDDLFDEWDAAHERNRSGYQGQWGPDIPSLVVEAKATENPGGNLFIPPGINRRKARSWNFFAAIYRRTPRQVELFPSVKIIGWMEGEEALKKSRVHTRGGYLTRREELHSPASFLDRRRLEIEKGRKIQRSLF
jgi:hypothetical protein